jgi:NADH-ubiquinone oxidoreductase chain 5
MHWTGIFLVVAAFGKSAQFLLHTWLPNSMEGPTPVSALLHAATLVAGGTYLLLRCSAIIGASSTALMLAAIIGTISAIFAASTALFQSDAKRIIAYSTMSQFGYLTASIGLGQASSTLFHLSSHSGFKALLFITAGGVIHATSDQQDIRKLGGLISALPFTYCGMLIGSLSLIATPYLSGFFSKDLILELAIAQATIPGS